MKRMSTLSALDGLAHFDDISALGGGGGDLETVRDASIHYFRRNTFTMQVMIRWEFFT